MKKTTSELPIDTLTEFLSYFQKKGKSIPLKYCSKVLSQPGIMRTCSSCFSNDILVNGNLKYVIIDLQCLAGARCENRLLIVLKGGEIVSQLLIGKEYADLGSEESMVHAFKGLNVVELNTSVKKFNNDDDRTIKSDTSFMKYYSINQDGLVHEISKP